MEREKEDVLNGSMQQDSEDVSEPVVKKKGKKVKGQKKHNGDKKIIVAGVSLILAFVVFIVLLTVKEHIVNSVETRKVVVAVVDVPKGIHLTEENMTTYFTMTERVVGELPIDTYSSGYELVGKVTFHEISKNQVLTSKDVTQEDFYEGIEDPVEISIEVGKIGQAVGGVLRAGDLIDINQVVNISEMIKAGEENSDDVINEDVPPISNGQDGGENNSEETETDENVLQENPDEVEEEPVYSASGIFTVCEIAKNVRVTRVFNSAGQGTNELEAEGTEQVSTVINIAIPRSLEKQICLALEEGTIRISRVAGDGKFVDMTVNENESVVTEDKDNVLNTETESIDGAEEKTSSSEASVEMEKSEESDIEETENVETSEELSESGVESSIEEVTEE